jgi:D-alanyl-D-alanine dipeptidase
MGFLPGSFDRHSGMARKRQTRNLEIPGSMLRVAPE